MAAKDGSPDAPLILIDGVCNLCNAIVRFILRHERAPVARFASLQSDLGRRTLEQFGLPTDDLDTFVLIENGQAYIKSTGACRATRLLKAPWSWARVLRFIPRPIRDWAYDRIANNRYRMFGRQDQCRIASPEERHRFIDADEFTPPPGTAPP
jgi:predicted DCC family thiol-disulfide oxidoreductase YuxK